MPDEEYVVQNGPNGPFVHCPRCEKDIDVGSGGRANFVTQHLPSAKCRNAMEKRLGVKKAKPKPVVKTPSMMANFLERGKSNKTHVPSTVARAVPKPPLPSATAPPSKAVDPKAASVLPAPKRQDFVEELAGLIARLPPSIPEATEYDDFAALAGNPAFSDDPTVEAVDLWEHTINKTLKGVLGWQDGRDLKLMIKRGRYGLDALLSYMKYFVVKRGVDVSLFEGKLKPIIEVLRDVVSADISPGEKHNRAQPEDVVSLSVPPSTNAPSEKSPAQAATAVEYECIDVDTFEFEDTVKKTSTIRLCSGYALTLPKDKNPYDDYPYPLHKARHLGKDAPDLALPWNYEVRDGLMTIYARSCPRILKGSLKSCKACQALKHSKALDGVLTRMETGVHPNSPLAFHPYSSFRKVIEEKNRQIQYYRLRSLNQAKSLLGKVGALDEHKRMLMAIASGKVQRVDRVISAGLRKKKGTRTILASVLAAARGFYRPRGTTEEEDMRAILIWRLGGNRVAEINHRATGAPSMTYLRSRSTIPPITPSPAQPTSAQVRDNLNAVFTSILSVLRERMSEGEVVHAVLMFDELATEKRLRYDAATNMILGLCRQHAHKTSLEFINEDDLKEIFRLLDENEVHYAAEATVGGIGILTEDHRIYPARPVLISGDCKRENGEQHARLIQTVLKGVDAEKENTKIRVVSLASDGESRRGAAFVHLTLKKLLDKTSPIYNLLCDINFLDLHVGDDDLTCDKDWKHVFKRLRNLLLRRRGVVVNNIRITPDILKEHMRAESVPADHIRATFDPKDQQDVKLAFDMLKDIWTLPRTTSNPSPTVSAQREAIWTLGQTMYHLVFPYLCIDLSLSEQLEHLSAAAHMFLALYSKSGKDFIPTELYLDIAHLLKNIIFCLAKAKKDTPDAKFYIILLGTDRLEELFGILRTMIGNDANLDILQLVQRLAGTTEVANILAKYPHWDRAPRRLKLPTLRRDSTELPQESDHLKPGSWRGDVFVKNVSIRTSWNRGRNLVAQDFPDLEVELRRLDAIPGVTILAPAGVPLFTVPRAVDDVDESVEDVVLDVPQRAMSEEDEARIEIEDSMTHLDLEATTAGTNNSKTIKYNGSEVPKARALSLASKYRNMVPGSTDRLRRVQEIPRYMSSSENAETLPNSKDDTLLVSDPITSLLSCDGRVWLCIGEVSGIFLEGRSVQSIPHSVLPEKIATVDYQLLGLQPATVMDDPSQENDWRTYRMFEKSFTVPGVLVQPIDPVISSTHAAGEAPWYLLSSNVLVALAASLFQGLTNDALKAIPILKVSNEFPYRNTAKQGCFLCSNDGAPNIDALNCPRCSPPVPLNVKNGQRVLEHIAAHIVFDPTLDKTWPVCGLCLQPPTLCQYFIKKGGIDAAQSKGCLLASLSWNYALALRSTDSAFCTNAPITCPLCPSTEPAIWRYFMKAHFVRMHPRVVDDYKYLWKRGDAEEEKLKAVWDSRMIVPKKRRSRKPQIMPVVASEDHRARIPEQLNDALNDIVVDTEDIAAEDGDEPEGSSHNPRDHFDEDNHRTSSPDLPTVNELVRGSIAVDDGGTREDREGNDEDTRVIALTAVSIVADSGDSVSRAMTALPEPCSSNTEETAENVVRPTEASLENPSSSAIPERSAPGAAVEQVPAVLNEPAQSSPPQLGRRRTVKQLMDSVRACCDDNVLGPDDIDVIKCSRSTCPTGWYHLECVAPVEGGKAWVCEACTYDRPRKKSRK